MNKKQYQRPCVETQAVETLGFLMMSPTIVMPDDPDPIVPANPDEDVPGDADAKPYGGSVWE